MRGSRLFSGIDEIVIAAIFLSLCLLRASSDAYFTESESGQGGTSYDIFSDSHHLDLPRAISPSTRPGLLDG